VEAQSLILALNETRKTLLASRLLVVQGSEARPASLATEILPGDGVWIADCGRLDTAGTRVSIDLLFLDAAHRVLTAVTNLPPGSACPRIEEAIGVLQLAPGTIQLSKTREGDQVVLEPIVPRPTSEAASIRAPRS
jgi:hypothetical protein